MKQPAKVSIVGAILAIVAAIFYPDLAGKSAAGEATPNAAAPVAPPSNQPSNETPAPNKPPAATPTLTNPAPANPPASKPPVVDKPATPPPAKAPAAGPDAAKPPPTTPAPKPVTTPAVTPPKPTQQPTPKPAQPAPTTSKVGFTSRRSWEDHFEKHGAEFGKITADDYLAKAQALRDAPLSRDILEATRKDDGVICRFDKRSGAFLAYHADKTIRTFFRPNDGEAYFRRQLNRLPQSDR